MLPMRILSPLRIRLTRDIGPSSAEMISPRALVDWGRLGLSLGFVRLSICPVRRREGQASQEKCFGDFSRNVHTVFSSLVFQLLDGYHQGILTSVRNFP